MELKRPVISDYAIPYMYDFSLRKEVSAATVRHRMLRADSYWCWGPEVTSLPDS